MNKDFDGIICNSCGVMSNNEDDWDVSDDDIECLRCRSRAEPHSPHLGVNLV